MSDSLTTRIDAGRDIDPDVERMERAVARARVRVAGNLLALRREVARRTDWREWVRERPLPFVAAAFAVGVLLGSRGGHG